MASIFFVLNLIFLIISFSIITILKVNKVSFSLQTFLALILGVMIGLFIFYTQSHIITENSIIFYSLEIYRVISEVYINLLKAMIYPLIIVAILTSLTKVNNIKELGSYGVIILILLLFGVAIASSTAIIVMYFLGTTNNVFLPVNTISNLSNYIDNVPKSLADIIINFFPVNPFLDLTGSRRSSTIATVIFILLIGISYILVKNQHPEETKFFKKFIDSLYVIIMKALSIIIRLTPYGILTLIAQVVTTTSIKGMLTLTDFLIANCIAIILVFIFQTILILFFGLNPFIYYKKVLPLLLFAFSSRSSAASIPIGIDTQINKLGINPSIANLSTTLGSIIGQVGCVGIYATIVIFMTASAVGYNPWHISSILFTIFIVVITSIGIGGIGGGAIYGALIALAAFNYPVAILGLLIPIDAIIDMFRTTLNVNGLTISGLLTSKITNSINIDTFKNKKLN